MSTEQMKKLIDIIENAEVGDVRTRASELRQALIRNGWAGAKLSNGKTGSTIKIPDQVYDPEMKDGNLAEKQAMATTQRHALQVKSIADKFGATVKIVKYKNEGWPRTTGYTLKIVCMIK